MSGEQTVASRAATAVPARPGTPQAARPVAKQNPESSGKPAKKLMRFRLKVGLHLQGRRVFRQGTKLPEDLEVVLPDGSTEEMEAGTVVEHEKVMVPSKWYRARGTEGYQPGNDIVLSPVDLAKKHGSDKFERLGDKPDPDETELDESDVPELERMNQRELLKYAKAERIDLKGAGSKRDVIARIRKVKGEKSSEE